MSLYLENIKNDTYCIIEKYEDTKGWEQYMDLYVFVMSISLGRQRFCLVYVMG